MSNIEDDEPIQYLTRAQFEELRAEARKHKQRIQANANKIAEAEVAAYEEGLEIGLKIWKLRKAGHPFNEIRHQMGISKTVMDTCLREFELRMGMEAGRMAEHYRMLDDERIEDMMRYWLPIACEGRIRIEKIRDGQAFSEMDFDRPLKAGYWVLQAMNMRLKIMAAARPEGQKESNTNVLVWLQQIMPGVQNVVKNIEQVETLVMETEAEK